MKNETKVVSFPWHPPESRLQTLVKLVERRLRRFYRDKSDLVVTLLQPPVLAWVFFVVFQTPSSEEVGYFKWLGKYDEPNLLIFLAVLTTIWFGTSKAIVEIPDSRILYQQEKLSFLKNVDYLLATLISLSLIVGLQVMLFTLTFQALFISLPMGALNLKLWISFTALLWLTALSTITLAMLFSMFVKTRMAAITMMTFVMIIQLLLGGSLVKPLIKMFPGVQVIADFMPSRWGFEGSIILFDKLAANLNKDPNTVFSFANYSGNSSLRNGTPPITVTSENGIDPWNVIGNVNKSTELSPDEQKLWQVMQTTDPTLQLYRPAHALTTWLMQITLSICFFLLGWFCFALLSKHQS